MRIGPAARRLTRRWIAVAGLAIVTLGAASPSPSAAPPAVGPGTFSFIQAWLDSDSITPDAPPGGIVEAGVTFWDLHQHELAQISGIYVRLDPAKGKAAPSEGKVTNDFPGHVVAALVVPEGGPGSIQVGVMTEACTDPGGCADVDVPFKLVGIGPPPEMRPEAIVTATFQPFVGDIVAGRTFPVRVDAMPRGLWDLSALRLADGLVVHARAHGGAELASAPLEQQGDLGTPFIGHLTIPETGLVDLTVALPGTNGGPDLTIDGSTMPVTVIEGGRRESPSPGASAVASPEAPAPAAPAEIPPIVWVVGVGAVLVVVGLVLRRVLADL